jgi:DNA-binding response OmpR family regulator
VTWKTADGHGSALRGQRILVVEDEPLIALELKVVLDDDGAKVVGPVSDLAESLRLARTPLSAALLDVRLGPQTAAPLAQLLHEQGVPFAFYTGQTETDSVRRQWPAAPAVAKPSPGRVLVAVGEGLCRSSKPGAAQAGDDRVAAASVGKPMVAGGGLEPPTCGL